jgi:hypothetical protein
MRKLLVLIFLLTAPVIPVRAQIDTTAEAQIEQLVAGMEAAVLDQDAETYLSYVDLSDENFATEHTVWTKDWSEEDFLTSFELDIENLEIEDNTATGDLTLAYTTDIEEQPGFVAEFPVVFTYDEKGEQWLYAGEYWTTTETDHFLVHASPGTEMVVEFLIPQLNDIYESVTESYGHIPERAMEIKLYNTREALVASAQLSLPMFNGWNEPNESLKIFPASRERLATTVAHEFTHFLTFDQAEHEQPVMPWWLAEGIATYIGQDFDLGGPALYIDNYLLPVQQLVEDDALAEWRAMERFWETPVKYWRYAYPQGYSFVSFVTETYGEDLRNEWLASMATEMTIDEASQEFFDLAFEELEADFREWILEFQE